MFKAEHERMFQEANQGIIEIRKSEIDFYLRVASALGTQAALVGGFAYLTFSQNLEAHYVYTYYVNTVYYVAAGMTVAFAIHVMLNTMLIQILGPGLALNGPVGSMARAVEGMRVEQKQVLGSFFIMMTFFAFSTLLLFWVTMDKYSAVASTIGFIVCARYWFFYCGRIYRRFYWERKDGPQGDWRHESTGSDEPTIPIRLTETRNPLDIEAGAANAAAAAGADGDSVRPSLTSANLARQSIQQPRTSEFKERPTLFERMSLIGGSTHRGSIIDQISNAIMPGALREGLGVGAESVVSSNSHYAHRPSMQGFVMPPNAQSVNPKAVACEGFVVMHVTPLGKGGGTPSGTGTRGLASLWKSTSKKWERRYVVLNYRGEMFYYVSRAEFKSNPHNHINPRPLSLDDFYVSVEGWEEAGAEASSSGAASSKSNAVSNGNTSNAVASTSGKEGADKLSFTLIPKDDERFRHWQYRTDTEEELVMWLAAMRQVSPDSFRMDF